MTTRLTITKTQERKLRTYARDVWQGSNMKKEYDFKNAERGLFAKTTSKRDRERGLQRLRPRTGRVSFDASREVIDALRALRDTGFFGNGVDCASVAEELLRRALLDPEVAAHWQEVRPAGRLRFDPDPKELRDLLTRSAAKLRRETRRSR